MQTKVRPWEHVDPDDPRAPFADFRNFLFVVWEFLGLPEPTPAQYAIAYYMQHGPSGFDPEVGRADIVEAFRGVGKSFIAAAFVLWRLMWDPVDEKILVLSASSNKAKEFVAQAKAILMGLPELAFLRPAADMRDMKDSFDVRGASVAQSPSLKAAGVTSQITGGRATLIVADDIEVKDNARTEEARTKLLRDVLEFFAIKVPARRDPQGNIIAPAGDVLMLGTPQTEESIYTKMVKGQGFHVFCVPARYPTSDKVEKYSIKRDDGSKVNILAPFITENLNKDKTLLPGRPVDPKRFSEADLQNREAKGRSFFQLQYMLDTTLSDAERYPLKGHDLIVYPVNPLKAPITIQWGRDSDRKNVRDDIPNYGFSGDFTMGPLFVDNEWRPFTGKVMFVDPAGRGKDECAHAIVNELNGVLYLAAVWGSRQEDGTNLPVDLAMLKIANDAFTYNVNVIEIEPNFAPGVWLSAFMPIMLKVWETRWKEKGVKRPNEVGGCSVVESEWKRGQKEVRIIDTLEPVMNLHRLVVDEAVAKDETFMYQLTHITRERGSLTHEDRLDAVAGAVSHYQRHMAIDMNKAAQQVRESELDAMIEDFLDCAENGSMRYGRTITGRRLEPGTHTEWYRS